MYVHSTFCIYVYKSSPSIVSSCRANALYTCRTFICSQPVAHAAYLFTGASDQPILTIIAIFRRTI